jgi:hypothetical protein
LGCRELGTHRKWDDKASHSATLMPNLVYRSGKSPPFPDTPMREAGLFTLVLQCTLNLTDTCYIFLSYADLASSLEAGPWTQRFHPE